MRKRCDVCAQRKLTLRDAYKHRRARTRDQIYLSRVVEREFGILASVGSGNISFPATFTAHTIINESYNGY